MIRRQPATFRERSSLRHLSLACLAVITVLSVFYVPALTPVPESDPEDSYAHEMPIVIATARDVWLWPLLRRERTSAFRKPHRSLLVPSRRRQALRSSYRTAHGAQSKPFSNGLGRFFIAESKPGLLPYQSDIPPARADNRF